MTGPQLGQPKEYLQRIRATLANRPDADEDKGSSGSDWGDSGSDSDGDGDSAGAAATRKQHAPMPPVTLPRSAPFLATTDDTAAEGETLGHAVLSSSQSISLPTFLDHTTWHHVAAPFPTSLFVHTSCSLVSLATLACLPRQT